MAFLATMGALLIWLAALLVLPFLHPRTYLFFMAADSQQPLNGPVLDYVDRDWLAFQETGEALASRGSAIAPVRLENLKTKEEMSALGADLQASLGRSSDICILYVSAAGVCEDESAYLICSDFRLANAEKGRYDVAGLLDQIRDCDAAVKVLILDVGRIGYDPRLGAFTDKFASLLRSRVQELDDPRLWVFTSNAAGEQSHVSRSLERSVFSYFVTRGLSGAADTDEDRFVSLDELYRYVSVNVAAVVRAESDAIASQTPELIWGGGEVAQVPQYPRLLRVGRVPEQSEPIELAQTMQTAQAASRTLSYYGLANIREPETLAREAAGGLRPSRVVGGRLGYALDTAVFAPAPMPGLSGGSAATESSAAAGDGAEDGAGAKGDAKGEGDDGAAADAEPEDPAVREAKLAERRAALLAEAWQLRDALLSPPPGTPRPLDYAPHLWQAVQERLRYFDQRFRAASIDEESFDLPLGELVGSLKELLEAGATGDFYPLDAMVQQIARLRVNVCPQVAPAYSLAMVQMLSRQGCLPAAPPMEEAAARFDQLIASGSQEDLEKWLAESLPEGFAEFSEIRLAQQLIESPELSWDEIQLAVRTRRQAEQVAAASRTTLPWIREMLESADRIRREAERELLDQVSARWPARARSQLEEAAQVYAEAAAIIQDVTAVTHFAAELTDRAADYLRWRNSAGRDIQPSVPSQHQLARLLDTLTETCTLLEQPDPRQITRLRRLYVSLIQLRQQIETGLSGEVVDVLVGSPGDAWKIEAILNTVLPDGPTRMRLLAAAAAVESQRLRGVTFPSISQPAPLPQPPTRDDWQWLVDQARLEVKLARLATFIAGESSASSTAEAAYEELDEVCCGLAEVVLGAPTSSTTPSPSRSESLQAVAKMDSALASFHRNLPARINDLISSANGRSDASQRDLQMREYRAALRALRCVDPRDVTALEGLDLKRRIVRAETYDHLAWLRQRQLAAREDSPAGDVEAWTVAAENYRRMAVSIRDQPPLTADLPAPLAIEGAADLSLISTPEDTVRVTLRNTSSQELRVWVLRHFDAEMLDVQTVPTPGVGQVYDQSRWESDRGQLRNAVSSVASHAATPASASSPASAAGAAASPRGQAAPSRPPGEYPPRPDLIPLPESLVLPVGKSVSIPMLVRRRETAYRPTRLIVKAVAISEAGGGSCYVRHPIEVAIPSINEVQLEVVGIPGSWTKNRGGLSLQPFPNRSTEYRLQLRNPSPREQTLDIQVLGTGLSEPVSLPQGALPPGEAQRLLERFQPTDVLIPEFTVKLPQGDDPVGIPFPKKGAAPKPGGGDAGEDPAGDQPAGEGPAASDSPPGGDPTRPLPASILVVLRDRGTGRQTIQHVGLAVQRPRRYLRPRVGYDPERERVEISFSPLDRALLPPGDVTVRGRFEGDIPPGTQANMTAKINARQPTATLSARMPAARGRVVRLVLDVDDYPRAFVYDVPCWSAASDIPERSDLMEVRITDLPGGRVYGEGTDAVPIRLQVDAPEGAFAGGQDSVYVGLDEDRDRELSGERKLRLTSDRQAELFLEQAGPAGELTIGTRVGDFALDIPTVGSRGGRVGVLAELALAGRSVWSEPVEIVLDGSSPRLLQPRLRPGPEIPLGEEFELSVLATDDDLSGVAQVEAAIDVAAIGRFAEKPKPVPAEQDPDTGAWIAKLPTAKLPLGAYRLLMRATDQVGNVSEYGSVTIQVVPPASQAAMDTNQVSGTAFYGSQPIADVQVKLTPAAEGPSIAPAVTSELGVFVFTAVPPGKYLLQARALINNEFRLAEAEVEVAAPPAQATIQDLKLR